MERGGKHQVATDNTFLIIHAAPQGPVSFHSHRPSASSECDSVCTSVCECVCMSAYEFKFVLRESAKMENNKGTNPVPF